MSEELLHKFYYCGVTIKIYGIVSNCIKFHRIFMDFRTIGVDRQEEITDLRPNLIDTHQRAIYTVDDFLRAWSVSTIQTHVLELKMNFDPSKPIIEVANDFTQVAKALNKVIGVSIRGMWMVIGPNNTTESVRKNYYQAVLNMANRLGAEDVFKDKRNEEKPLSMY